MSTADARDASRLFVILNPGSGSAVAEVVQATIARFFSCDDGTCDIHHLREADDLSGLAREAARRGCDVVVAAGGDGTVSAVASGLVGTQARLGILPLGTGNVLARELEVPLDLDAAVALLAGPNRSRPVDAMEVDGRHFFTQIGVGLDALMIRDTDTASKKRFGRLAYLWTAARQLVGLPEQRFTVKVDGQRLRHRAVEVLVANSGTLGQRPFTWGPGIRPDDGKVNVCILRTRTAFHYLRVAWNVGRGRHRDDPLLRYVEADGTIRVECERALPVQADGEIIGQTPVEVRVRPAAVRVVVPSGAGDFAK